MYESFWKRVKKLLYPIGHLFGEKVPKGGSCCSKCKFLTSATDRTCGNDYFIWNTGSNKFTEPADEYCCDVFKAA